MLTKCSNSEDESVFLRSQISSEIKAEISGLEDVDKSTFLLGNRKHYVLKLTLVEKSLLKYLRYSNLQEVHLSQNEIYVMKIVIVFLFKIYENKLLDE